MEHRCGHDIDIDMTKMYIHVSVYTHTHSHATITLTPPLDTHVDTHHNIRIILTDS